jgi:ribonucleotide monophosphatase NagD (HAD superfamily)
VHTQISDFNFQLKLGNTFQQRMQQSEVFKSGEATIKYLEKQLEACGKINIVCEKSVGKATKEIEEHFLKCVNALAARKEVLLKQIAQRVADQRKAFPFFTLFFFLFSFCWLVNNSWKWQILYILLA